MRKLVLFLTLCLLISNHLTAQISHGGKPLPMTMLSTRSGNIFKEMPPFDREEQLRTDSLNESDLRSGYHFAYKFMTDFTPENSGHHFTLADGTRVWRLGIRSEGAYSINVLFTEYEVPEGAQLFLYNPDQTHILGSFNQLNNSELGILPAAPVQGDELIIEYQEPANAPFRGKLKVGEVNHDYRGFKSYEPRGDSPYFACMSPLACLQGETDKYDQVGRSIILIVINGETACTGVLINNTENDGKPYILTASHCLNNQFEIAPDYEQVAGNIVTFFNYESPLCTPVMRGAEEMSMASARFRATNENTDMALLELMETPPAYYQPYYAGWNAKDQGTAPYIGIHHPNASVKRVVKTEKVALSSYPNPKYPFEKNGHWHVQEWAEGCTYGGSSGSPLFDDNNRIIGGLSGGESKCSFRYDDYYFTLAKSWDFAPDADRQLKIWLDPANRNKELICNGLDPYSTTPAVRLSNMGESGKKGTIETATLPSPGTGPAFGNNSLGMTEFAESYKTTGDATIFGTYIVNPSISRPNDITVEITVYSGSDKPERLLHTELFQPVFTSFENDFVNTPKPLSRDQESFIAFSEPVNVSGAFFIGYKIKSTAEAVSFSAFNLPKGQTTKNTTWINHKGQWIEATAHPASPMSTSLFIDPVVQYNTASANTPIEINNPIRIVRGSTPKTIHILLPEEIRQARYSIFTTDGRSVCDGMVRSGQNTVAIPSATAGIYLIQITHTDGCFTQKILF